MVASKGSFTAAADELDMPKSAVSQKISRLEQELGVRLIERTTRRLHLTEIGTIYFHHCQNVINEMDRAELKIGQMQSEPSGLLRVTTSVTVGQQLVQPIIGEFLNQYPDINLQLDLTNQRLNLIEEGVDVAIRVGKLEDSTLVALNLGRSHVHFYANANWLAEQGKDLSVVELKSMPLLIMDDHIRRNLVLFSEKDKTTVPLNSKVTVNDFETLYRLTIEGVGIGLLPDYMGDKAVNSGELVKVLPQWRAHSVEFNAIYTSRHGVTPKLRAFLDFLNLKFAERLIR
ncbi:LysR substrate-binding domain-containing protein [Pseudomonas sp. HK3]|jgi:LysR family transcriptional regulator AphB